jgi:NADPH2:quinone reductase
MPKAVIIRQPGGPEAMEIVNIAPPKKPGPGQVIVKHTAIGLNYLDVYYRSGAYKAPRLPVILGSEAVGVVEAIGPGVQADVGQRVAYATGAPGAYSERRLMNVNHLVGVPDDLSDEIVAASLVKGMTAHYLLHRTFRVKAGHKILVHAAAGGTGQMICQWAKTLGATVIGTVGSNEKVAAAKAAGCDHVIVYTQEDFVQSVGNLTGGEGVTVAYDSVGKDTFAKSLQCLQPLGLLVSFGQASGPVPAFNVLSLAKNGAFVTRPTLNFYKADRKELVLTAIEVYSRLLNGKLKPNITKKYKLDDIVQAHKDLESRKTTGQMVIIP